MHMSPILIKIDDFFIINDKTCKKTIIEILNQNEGKYNFNIKILHHLIAKTIKKFPMNIHNLEERIHHLLSCKNFTELKEVLSRI